MKTLILLASLTALTAFVTVNTTMAASSVPNQAWTIAADMDMIQIFAEHSPGNDMCEIFVECPYEGVFYIYDPAGELRFSAGIQEGELSVTVDVAEYQPGIYTMIVLTRMGRKSAELVIEQQ